MCSKTIVVKCHMNKCGLSLPEAIRTYLSIYGHKALLYSDNKFVVSPTYLTLETNKFYVSIPLSKHTYITQMKLIEKKKSVGIDYSQNIFLSLTILDTIYICKRNYCAQFTIAHINFYFKAIFVFIASC